MSEKKKYDSTVARIAGNIVSGWNHSAIADSDTIIKMARQAVLIARAIVGEVERTEDQ